MKKITLNSLLCLSSCILAYGQQFSNGPLSTGASSSNSVAAPSGFTWSEMQSVGGFTNTNFGYGASYNNANSTNFALADDFVVPAGETWQLTSSDIFLYQTGFAGTGVPVDQLRVWILDGDPTNTTPPNVVHGNNTSNVINVANSADALMYRISNASPGTTRKIFRINANTSFTLTPGTYWFVFQAHATNDGGIFVPPVTILGSRGPAGANSRQKATDNTWTNVIDNSTNTTTPNPVPQAIPFQLNYTVLSTETQDLIQTKVYPNPASDFVILSSVTPLSSIQLLDVNGRVLRLLDGNQLTEVSIGISELNSGVYILNIKTENGMTSKRFVKN